MDESASEIVKALVEQEKESNTFIRHYEDVRFKITQINVALAVILVGATNVDALRSGKIFFAVFIVLLGIEGVLICLKYTERADRHAAIARANRAALSRLLGGFHETTLEEIHENAAKRHKHATLVTRIFSQIRARWCWIFIHASVAALGIFIAYSAARSFVEPTL